jgi:hypothetical protein
MPQAFRPLVDAAWLATRHASIDPMDRAVAGLASRAAEYETMDWPMVREWPQARIVGNVHRLEKRRGAFFGCLQRSTGGHHRSVPSYGEKTARIMEHVQAMAEKGLRVLGVGIGTTTLHELPESQHDFDFAFAGLVGFEDPLRPTVPAASREAVLMHMFERGRMTFRIAAAIAVSVVSICIVQPNLAELFGFGPRLDKLRVPGERGAAVRLVEVSTRCPTNHGLGEGLVAAALQPMASKVVCSENLPSASKPRQDRRPEGQYSYEHGNQGQHHKHLQDPEVRSIACHEPSGDRPGDDQQHAYKPAKHRATRLHRVHW